MGLRAKSAVALTLALAVTLGLAVVIGRIALGGLRTHLMTTFARNATRLTEQRILTPVVRELTLARRFGASETTRQWLLDVASPQKRDAFFREAESFRSDFADSSYFIAPDASLEFYYNDHAREVSRTARYVLDESDPKHGWYFSTLRNPAEYNLNVDHDVALGVTKVWINVAVRDAHRPIGVAGTGFDLANFVGHLDAGAEPGVTTILVNEKAYIQVHPDQAQIAEMSGSGAAPLAEKTLFGLLGSQDAGRARMAMASAAADPDGVEVFDASLAGRNQLIAMSYLPELKWFVVSAVDVRVAQAGGTGFLAPAGAAMMLLILGLVAAFVLVVNRLLILPLKRLQLSAQAVAAGRYDVSLPPAGRDEIGVLTGAVATMADKVRRHTEELEATVHARTQDLRRTNEELEAARVAADDANHAKGAFLATMSHEMRTPMNAIIGMSGMLAETTLSGEQRDYLATIQGSGDHLLTVINDVLDFSKLESGLLELERSAFGVADVVEDALDLVAVSAHRKHLELAYELDASAPAAVIGDAGRVRQVLVNYLSNAVKFTEVGEVVVVVSADARGAAGLHFAVRDTGIGIPVDRFDRLFKSFSQVDGSTFRRYGGTGLGLAISARLAEQMGGRAWAESERRVGSTFHFTIVADAAAGAPDRRPELAGLRAWLLGHNDTIRGISRRLLERCGAAPRDSASPADAFDWARRGDPCDVVVIDHHLPDVDGFDIAAKLGRELPAAARIVVCAASAPGEHPEEPAAGVAVLSKPVRRAALFAQLVSARSGGVVPAGNDRSSLPGDLAQRNPLRVLVAEDNAVNVKVIMSLLGRLGYRADVAGNGLEAVAAVERQPYDLVLMDVQMPEMDGMEAAREIRRRRPFGRTPRILALTGGVMSEERRRCIEAGMDAVIAKPLVFSELIDALSVTPRVGD